MKWGAHPRQEDALTGNGLRGASLTSHLSPAVPLEQARPESRRPDSYRQSNRVSRHSYALHQGILIPWPQCHNAMNFMRVVGPPGLEPDDVGFGSLLVSLSRPAL